MLLLAPPPVPLPDWLLPAAAAPPVFEVEDDKIELIDGDLDGLLEAVDDET